MTDRSTWIAEKRQLDKLRTPEGQAQDCLERSRREGMEREGGYQVSDLRYPETPQRRSQAPEGRDRRLTHHHH